MIPGLTARGERLAIMVAVALLAFASLLWYVSHTATIKERDRNASAMADSLAKRSAAVSDSTAKAVRAGLDSARRADSVKIAERDRQLATATRTTNAALQSAQAARAEAERVLNDTASSAPVLRATLARTVAQFDSVVAAFQIERAMGAAGRIERDSLHARELRLARAGFDSTHAADQRALARLHDSFAVDLKTARDGGLRTGRVQGGIVALPVIALLIWLVK